MIPWLTAPPLQPFRRSLCVPCALAFLTFISLVVPGAAVIGNPAQTGTRVPVTVHGPFHQPPTSTSAAAILIAPRVSAALSPAAASVVEFGDDFTVAALPANRLVIRPDAIRATPREPDTGARTMPGVLAATPDLSLNLNGESEPSPGFVAGNFPHLADSLVPFPWEAPPTLGGVDPQIAASRTHVIVSTSSWIAFYDRGGELLGPKSSGSTFPNPVSAMSFFAPLTADMTANLNLPDGVDPVTFGLTAFYDTRVIFDPHRSRFWVVAEAVNINSKKEGVANTAAQKGSRRTKMMVAVSRAEDPRDGFHYYWWDQVEGDGACNELDGCPGTPFRPGDAGDYPALGITSEFFIQTNSVGAFNPAAKTWDEFSHDVKPRYTRVVFTPAATLAAGQPAQGWAFNDLRDPDGNVGRWIVQPAMQYGAAPGGLAYLSMSFGGPGNGSRLVIWGFASDNGVPQSPVQRTVSIRGARAPLNAPQKATSEVPSPNRIRLDNMGSSVLKATVRNDMLHATFQDCTTWSGTSECSTSIRVVRVSLAGFSQGALLTTPASGFIDQTFGRRNNKDGPGDVFSYGMPGIAVNQDGDMLVVYNRSGTTIFPEARYSIFYGDEVSIRPSFQLHAGEAVLVNPNAKPKDSVGQIDTGGISVDPLDDRAFWVAQPYAYRPDPKQTKSQWRLAIARIVVPQNINVGG